MADQQELNKLNVKSDSLPNNWLVTLVNPVTGAVAENMTVARFIELLNNGLPVVTDYSKGIVAAGKLYNFNHYDPKDMDLIQNGAGYATGNTINANSATGPFISFGRDGAQTQIISNVYTGFTYIRIKIFSNGSFNWGPWIKINASNSYSVDRNLLTDTVSEQVQVSNSTPMTLAKTGEPTPAYQEVERYEYSIPKMAEAILKLQKELDTLKGR